MHILQKKKLSSWTLSFALSFRSCLPNDDDEKFLAFIVCHLHRMMGFKLLWSFWVVNSSQSVCLLSLTLFPLCPSAQLVYMNANNGWTCCAISRSHFPFHEHCASSPQRSCRFLKSRRVQGKVQERKTLIIHKRHLITLIEGERRMMRINYDWVTFQRRFNGLFRKRPKDLINIY